MSIERTVATPLGPIPDGYAVEHAETLHINPPSCNEPEFLFRARIMHSTKGLRYVNAAIDGVEVVNTTEFWTDFWEQMQQ